MCFMYVVIYIYINIPQHIGMTSNKFVASQARCDNQYKNLLNKVLKCCANIF